MAWIDSNWVYRKKITIASAKVSGTHVNIPITINETDVDLKFTASGGHVGIIDGTDILFTLSDGTSQLSHEIEQYVSTTGQLVAHVKMPTLSDVSDTDIYIYYGYAAAADQQDVNGTWDGNFESVWHMNTDPSSDLLDSTSHGINPTSYGSMGGGNSVQSAVGKGLDFTANNQGVFESAGYNANGDSEETIEVVFNADTINGAGNNAILINYLNPTSYGLTLDIHNGNIRHFVFTSSTGDASATGGAVSTGTDHYAAGSWKAGENSTVNFNGVHTNGIVGNGGLNRAADNWEIGNTLNVNVLYPNRDFDGIITEIRISSSRRSLDWLDTTYETLINPGTFYSTAAEETESPPAPALVVFGLQDTFFPDVDPHDTTKDLFSNDDHGDSFFDVISCFERDVSFDIINDFSKDTSWDILNDFTKDTSWCTLNDFAKLIAWDIIKDYNQGTSWHIFDANIESIANFILKYIESNFDITPPWEDPISNFSLKTLQTSFTLREPITTNFKLVGIRDNIITP